MATSPLNPKHAVRKLLAKRGYEFSRIEKPTSHKPPVELSVQELAIVEDVLSQNLTMVSRHRLWSTILACKHALDQQIEGDFVECGVWRGGNSIAAAELFRLHDSKRSVWLFDTFAGMTPPTIHDVKTHSGIPAAARHLEMQQATHNEWCYASLDDVKSNFARRGLGPNVHLVAGDVSQTLEGDLLPDKIAILRLDTDFYDSTRKELEVLYPRLSIGGCLLIDDYGHWSGARKATDEYFNQARNRPFLQYVDSTGRTAVKVK